MIGITAADMSGSSCARLPCQRRWAVGRAVGHRRTAIAAEREQPRRKEAGPTLSAEGQGDPNSERTAGW